MLDSLSNSQANAYHALDIGPVWLSRDVRHDAGRDNEAEVGARDQATNVIELGLFLGESDAPLSDSVVILLKQILKSVHLQFENAVVLQSSTLGGLSRIDTLVVFGDATQLSILTRSGEKPYGTLIQLPSLLSVLTQGQSKATAWAALKTFLLSRVPLLR
jgi:hypothetical protein